MKIRSNSELDPTKAARIAALAVGGQGLAPAGRAGEGMESLQGGMTQDELEALAKDLFPPLGYWDPLNLAKADCYNCSDSKLERIFS